MMKGSLCRQIDHKNLILPTFQLDALVLSFNAHNFYDNDGNDVIVCNYLSFYEQSACYGIGMGDHKVVRKDHMC